MSIAQKIFDAPKAGLHVHLEGTIEPEMPMSGTGKIMKGALRE